MGYTANSMPQKNTRKASAPLFLPTKSRVFFAKRKAQKKPLHRARCKMQNAKKTALLHK